MAEIVNNDKGFKVLKLSPQEALNAGMGIPAGCICVHCNNIIANNIYYIAVLNDCMCENCYNEWFKDSKYYPEDAKIEERNFNFYYNRIK